MSKVYSKFDIENMLKEFCITIIDKGFAIWGKEYYEYENEDIHSYKLTKPYSLDEENMVPTVTTLRFLDTHIGIDNIESAITFLIEIDFPNESDFDTVRTTIDVTDKAEFLFVLDRINELATEAYNVQNSYISDIAELAHDIELDMKNMKS